jgi:hypothetical protein
MTTCENIGNDSQNESAPRGKPGRAEGWLGATLRVLEAAKRSSSERKVVETEGCL